MNHRPLRRTLPQRRPSHRWLSVATAGLCAALAAAPAGAQEHGTGEAGVEHEEAPRHRVAIFTGNTWVPQSGHDGAIDGWIAAPTIGVDYAFRLSERFGIMSINDFQIDQYVIEREDGSELERERLFVTSLVLVWEAIHAVRLFAGPGVETDKHETLGLVKVGAEWEFLQAHPWDVALNVAWDIKGEYDAIAVGLSVGRVW